LLLNSEAVRQISRPAGPITVPELYEGPWPGYL